MRFLGIKIATIVTVVGFIALNAWDYTVHRAAYFENLKESGMTWAGAWFWGFPFKMFWSGAGMKGDEWGIEPGRFIVNVLLLTILIMLLGAIFEKVLDRIRSR